MLRYTGILILNVRHRSRVAAIQSPGGSERLLQDGLVEALEASGLPVTVVEVSSTTPVEAGEVAASFDVADRIARELRRSAQEGRLALVLSGSCHTAIGSVAGLPEGERGVVWLDGHGDFNTPETTGSGLLDGTTLASITGRCWTRMCAAVEGFAPVPDERVVLIGVRDLDPGEARALAGSAVVHVSSAEALDRGVQALHALGERAQGVYVHVDLDVLDPSVGKANAFAKPGGLSGEELRAVLEAAFERCPVRCLAFTAYDPETDPTGAVSEAAVAAAGAIAELMRRTWLPHS